MKVLICDPIDERAVARLREAGLSVTVKTGMGEGELAEELRKGYDAIVVRSATKVRRPALDAAQGLRLIIRAGVGLDNIDADYAEAKGIKVLNTPKASTDSVAELALAHMFALARSLVRATETMREGKWEKRAFHGIELQGKTLGIIGIGRIGQALARRALCLGMRVLAYDKYVKESPLPGVRMVSLEELLRESDFVSLHIPPDPAGPVIGAREIALMKDGAFLINCARGGVVDERALLEALNSGKLGGAGLDVFEEEPPKNMELLRHPKVTLTPHIGAQTHEAQARIGDEIVEILLSWAKS
ncbi:MAG: D-2-hydroxyacid dehydrogenase [Candidatus Bipolaricaulota bacterium]|nr:D-2-hydroxyacid dehydrogenase [Candidatus Bipolaricaulota bacterium]MCX7844817.1 D-2-hydroxyacid dehydrogenase [Candidatus Bipolaricaulota bacterium]MDW8152323.1 D-2-hydroxyacid dehydrogenase [Candidatus Bipolaricaulota bacterium]